MTEEKKEREQEKMKNNEKRLVKITRENQQLFSRYIPDTFKKVLFQKGMNAVGIVAWDG